MNSSSHVLQGGRPISAAQDTALDRFWQDFMGAFITLVGVALMVSMPILAHTVHQLFGILAVLLIAGTLAVYAPHISIVAIFFSFMFQNLIVSLLSDPSWTDNEFDIIRSYNFLTLCVTWITIAIRFLARWRSRPDGMDVFIKMTVINLAAIGFYFVIGFALYSTAAIVNLRNIVTPLLLFQICMVVFSQRPVRIGPPLTGLVVLLLTCGFLEFFFRNAWLAATNSATYWTLAQGPNWATLDYDKMAKQSGVVVTGLTDTFRISFFNSPLLSEFGVQMMRLFGPNMHAISFAYCLSFYSIFTLYRGRFVQAALLFVLLFLCNAKGPLIVFLLTGVSWTIFQLFGSRLALTLHALVLVTYAIFGVIVGLQIGDYHVLGFMAGLYSFLGNPIGHGIGDAGNLSPLFNTINWEHAQALGRAPFPVESSVGVLMHQMGVFAFLLIGTYVWIAWRMLKLARETRNALQAAAAFGLLVIIGNGMFQEEAYFAPLALATYMALGGMILGSGIRAGMISDN